MKSPAKRIVSANSSRKIPEAPKNLIKLNESKRKAQEYKKLLSKVQMDSLREAEIPLMLPANLGVRVVKREDGTFSPLNSFLDDIQAEGEYFAFDGSAICA